MPTVQTSTPMCIPIFNVHPTILNKLRDVMTRIFTAINKAVECDDIHRAESFVRVLMTLPMHMGGQEDKQCRSNCQHLLAQLIGADVNDYPTILMNHVIPTVTTRSRPNNPDRAVPSTTSAGPRIPHTRLKKLLQAGLVSKAATVFASSLGDTRVLNPATDPHLRHNIQALFPQPNQHDAIPTNCPTDAMQLEVAEVQRGLTQLPKQSAAGMSGFTYDIIRMLGEGEGPEVEQFTEQLCEVFNGILRGVYSNYHLWSGDRVVPLSKPNSNGVRPIVVGDVWLRILGRLVAKQVAQEASFILAPHQFGVGVKGGCEVIAHALHACEDMLFDDENIATDWSIQTIDFSNAFNTVRRRFIYDELTIHFPSLIPYFQFCYSKPTNIYFKDGTVAAVCSTGVKQGDPLGPLFFALALQPVLKLVSKHVLFTSTDTVNTQGHLFAYLDDVTIVAPDSKMSQAVTLLSNHARRRGLQINISKSFQFHPGRDTGNTSTAFTNTGIKTLGTCIGTDLSKKLFSLETVSAITPTLEALIQLDPTISFPLLQATINTIPVYLARTLAPHYSKEALQQFDVNVDKTVLGICGSSINYLNLPTASKMVRSLPGALGGLALPRLVDIQEQAFAASFMAASQQLAFHCPNFVNKLHVNCAQLSKLSVYVEHVSSPHLVVEHSPEFGLKLWQDVPYEPSTSPTSPILPTLPTSALSSSSSAPTAPNLPPQSSVRRSAIPVFHNSGGPPIEIPTQKVLVKVVHQRIVNELRAILQDDKPALAWWTSCAYEQSTVLYGIAGVKMHNLSPEAFRTSLSMRMLLPVSLQGNFNCSQCHHTEDADLPRLDPRYHGLHCSMCQLSRMKRHDHISNHLASLLKRLFGDQAISFEPHLPTDPHHQQSTSANPLRADIKLQLGLAGLRYLDVTVVSPCSGKAITQHHSSSVPLAAATAQEHHKHLKYDASMRLLNVDTSHFIAFAMESSGQFGKEALNFLDTLPQLPTLKVSQQSAMASINYYKRILRTTVMIGNHIAIQQSGHQSI